MSKRRCEHKQAFPSLDTTGVNRCVSYYKISRRSRSTTPQKIQLSKPGFNQLNQEMSYNTTGSRKSVSRCLPQSPFFTSVNTPWSISREAFIPSIWFTIETEDTKRKRGMEPMEADSTGLPRQSSVRRRSCYASPF